MSQRITHVIGIDDAPFEPEHRGDVLIVGSVFCGGLLDGVVHSRVRRDGANSTSRIAEMVMASRYYAHLQLVMLQGIALAGFNVVDIARLSGMLKLPDLVVMRRQPDMSAIRSALLHQVPGGRRKWRLIQKAGEVAPVGELFVQLAGISLAEAQRVVSQSTLRGHLPEPVRTAHLIAGGMSPLPTRQRA
jgi:endonuclease V-like protein UPF0215 family